MIEKKISIYYFIIGTILLIYAIEQLLGYIIFDISFNYSWWICLIASIFGVCLILRGINLYNKVKKVHKS